MLSRLVITFLPRSKHLLISWLQSLSAVILEPQEMKSATVSTVSLSICHEVMETVETVADFIFLGSKITTDGDCSHEIKRRLLFGRKVMKQRHYFVNKGRSSQVYGFSSGHVWMWKLDYKESWALKNWCFWTVVLEKTLESPLDCKEMQPVHPKGDKSWVFTGRLMLKLKHQYFGDLMRRADSLEKTLMLRKIEGRRRRGQQRIRCLDGLLKHQFA